MSTTPEALYYSSEAMSRFATLESVTRHRQFDGLGAIKLPDIMDAHDFIRQHGEPLVMSPLFGAWLDRNIQMQTWPHGEKTQTETLKRICHIGNYATAVALTEGLQKETIAVIKDGYVAIPELGRVAMRGLSDAIATVRVDDDLTVSFRDTTVHVPRDALTESHPDWEPLRFIGPPDFRVALNDIDPNRDIFRYPVADRVSDTQHEHWHRTFSEAWEFIQEHDPQAAPLVRASLTTIVPAPTEPLTHGKSMAAAAAFGVIGINEHRDPERLASHIIFGTRKHLAMALRGEHEFHAEDDPTAKKEVYVPSREGYGTAMNLLDDSLINIGLARFFGDVVANARPQLREYAQLSFARWFYESQQNMRGLRESGYLTQQNEWVATALQQELSSLTDTYISLPEHVKQLVIANARDRYMAWRLHNSTPNAGAITYLRDLWLRGEPCPSITVPGSLSRSTQAYTHIGQRTRYVLHESRIKDPAHFVALQNGQGDPMRFGAPTPGDIAFASGDLRAARNYFLAAVRQNPHDPELWSGFAVTFTQETSPAAQAFAHAPELVAALYAAIGDSNINPEDVAVWAVACRVATK